MKPPKVTSSRFTSSAWCSSSSKWRLHGADGATRDSFFYRLRAYIQRYSDPICIAFYYVRRIGRSRAKQRSEPNRTLELVCARPLLLSVHSGSDPDLHLQGDSPTNAGQAAVRAFSDTATRFFLSFIKPPPRVCSSCMNAFVLNQPSCCAFLRQQPMDCHFFLKNSSFSLVPYFCLYTFLTRSLPYYELFVSRVV